MTAIKTPLRHDVRSALDALLAESFSFEKWDGYERAKVKLSAVCGWDAAPEQYDQLQYELAVSAYVKAAGL